MTTKITRQQTAAIQAEIKAAIEPILKKHGLAIRKNSARYSDFDIRVSIEMGVDSPESMAEAARQKFSWLFKDYGIDYGTEVTDSRGAVYTVVGFTRTAKLEARSTKDGKIYNAQPRFFRLNGKPLESESDRRIAQLNAEKAKGA